MFPYFYKKTPKIFPLLLPFSPGSKKKYLEPLRSLWQGAEGICWLAVVPSERLVPGAFYLDRKPQ
jgi:hypothetical protein